MKKVILSVVFVIIAIISHGQKLEKAKSLLDSKKLAEAKTEIDNVLAVEKNKTNAEAWYTKTKVYLAIAADPGLKA
ncbi:MAG: hypothetical protein ACKVOW_02850, partial [Chitinophagaceae bacterium]